ncbi:MAG: CPBP family glutamic-type intramembrane protease [Candidatus Helarchaeota archaeon]
MQPDLSTEKRQAITFLGGLARFKFNKIWLIISIILPLIINLGVVGLFLLTGNSYDFLKINWASLLPLFLMNFLYNIWEEFGWRGYALPKLQEKTNALYSSLIVGVFWCLWHWPHLTVYNSDMLKIYHNSAHFLIDVILDSLIFAWLYNSTDGNTLIATLFHASQNTFGLLIFHDFQYRLMIYWSWLIRGIIIIVVIAKFGIKSLSHRKKIVFSQIIKEIDEKKGTTFIFI